MQILHKAVELGKSLSVTTYSVLDESLFIPDLTAWGVLGGQGDPNAYQADRRLTNRLTMVRIGRFLKYELNIEDKDYGTGAGYFDDLW